MKRKKIALLLLSLLVVGCSPLSPLPRLVLADEIVVSGNGASAASDVSVTQQSTTTVQQTNQAAVSNNVTTDAKTGDNKASDNNGTVGVKTGNVTTDTTVTNQANTSTVDTSACCNKAPSSITVNGNGADTTNTVSVTNTTTVSTTTDQTATITNNVQGTAVTGNNQANDNQGNVTIITGNISHKESLRTGPVNTASVTLGLPDPSYTIKVKGNGTDSVNAVTLATNHDVTNTIYNTTNIFNNSFWDLMTGGNIANRNNGDVLIKTGNITSEVSIENKANESIIKDTCCHENTPPTPTPPSPTPTSKPGDGGGGNGGGGGDGSSSGGGSGSGSSSGSSTAAGGSILPVTGGSWMLFVLIGNIVMLFFGVLLRLRSGRSPGFTYNFVL